MTTEESLRQLLGELAVRAAQLRELLRLEAGAKSGPWGQEELRRQLQAAGVDLERARAGLARLRVPPSEAQRQADWAAIRGRRWRERYETAGGAALVALLGSAAAALALGLWSRDS